MARLRNALIGGVLLLGSLSATAAADIQVCVDDQTSCPALPGDDTATSGQPTSDQTTPDTGTLGPPVSVDPFAVVPTPASAPQVDQLVVSPGTGADKQHLPPGPPNFQIDP